MIDNAIVIKGTVVMVHFDDDSLRIIDFAQFKGEKWFDERVSKHFDEFVVEYGTLHWNYDGNDDSLDPEDIYQHSIDINEMSLKIA